MPPPMATVTEREKVGPPKSILEIHAPTLCVSPLRDRIDGRADSELQRFRDRRQLDESFEITEPAPHLELAQRTR